MPDQKKTSQRTTKTPATKNLKSRKKTFRRSEVAAENARPEKKHSGVQGRHRKCATRKKTILRSGAATENCRPENNKTTSSAINNATKKMRDQKNAFWRSVATTDNARPEKHCCVQRWPPKVRDQKNNILAFKGCHFKCPTRNKDNEQRKQTCMRKCATRKKQNNEQPKHLLRKTARPETRHSGVQRWPPEMRDQKKKHSGVQGRPSKLRDQKKTFPWSGAATENARPEKHKTTGIGNKNATKKNARPEKQHSGVHWRTPTTRDQKNIPAFRGGHRKFAIRKTTFRRSGAAISIA